MRWPEVLRQWKAAPVFGAAFLFVALVVLPGCTAVVLTITCQAYENCRTLEMLAELAEENEKDARRREERALRRSENPAEHTPAAPYVPPPTLREELLALTGKLKNHADVLVPSDRPAHSRILLLTAPGEKVRAQAAIDNPGMDSFERRLTGVYFSLRRSTARETAGRSALFTEVVSEDRRAFVFPRSPNTYVVRDLRIRFAYQLRADRKGSRKTPDYPPERNRISRAALEEPEANFWCVDHPDWPTPRVVKQEPPFLFATERTEFGGEGHGFLTTIRTMINDHTRKHFLSMAAEDFNAMLNGNSGFEPCPEVWKLPRSF